MTVRVLLWSWVRYLYKMLLSWWYQWTGPILTLENGIQVRVGPQLAQGGFSVVYAATLVHHPHDKNPNDRNKKNNNHNHRRYRDDDKNSDHGPDDDGHRADLESANHHHEENKEDETDFWNSHNNNNSAMTEYALKRICLGNDAELKQACLHEANVHAAVAHHPHTMPLLGFLQTKEYCYMLFPLCRHSLRHEMNRRTGLFLDDDDDQNQKRNSSTTTSTTTNMPAPWSELQVLQLFLRICSAVQALHEANYTHRDIKLENVLLLTTKQQRKTRTKTSSTSIVNNNNHSHKFGKQPPPYHRHSSRTSSSGSSNNLFTGSQSTDTTTATTTTIVQEEILSHPDDGGDGVTEEPVLMDFGSAGPLTTMISSRADVMTLVELAAQQTTLPYRPPELLDATGFLQVGMTLDYRAVDVWSLGCTLFALLYGASPLECEFNHNHRNSHYENHNHPYSSTSSTQPQQPYLKIVDCTTLRILNICTNPQKCFPQPPAHSPMASWYSTELTQDLIPQLLQAQPAQRMTLPTLIDRLIAMIEARGGGNGDHDDYNCIIPNYLRPHHPDNHRHPTNPNINPNSQSPPTTTNNTTTTMDPFSIMGPVSSPSSKKDNFASWDANTIDNDDDDMDGFTDFYSGNNNNNAAV